MISGSTPTYFGWIGAWNTTTVPNGTYTLERRDRCRWGQHDQRAHHDHGQQPAHLTAVLVPSNGATQSGGAAILDASASASVTSVSFELTGGTLSDQVQLHHQASRDLTLFASGREIHMERGERIFLNFRYRFTRARRCAG